MLENCSFARWLTYDEETWIAGNAGWFIGSRPVCAISMEIWLIPNCWRVICWRRGCFFYVECSYYVSMGLFWRGPIDNLSGCAVNSALFPWWLTGFIREASLVPYWLEHPCFVTLMCVKSRAPVYNNVRVYTAGSAKHMRTLHDVLTELCHCQRQETIVCIT